MVLRLMSLKRSVKSLKRISFTHTMDYKPIVVIFCFGQQFLPTSSYREIRKKKKSSYTCSKLTELAEDLGVLRISRYFNRKTRRPHVDCTLRRTMEAGLMLCRNLTAHVQYTPLNLQLQLQVTLRHGFSLSFRSSRLKDSSPTSLLVEKSLNCHSIKDPQQRHRLLQKPPR